MKFYIYTFSLKKMQPLVLRICCSFFLFTLFVFFLPFNAFGDVVINEFMVAPEQWVELYNRGDDRQDVSGFFLDDEGGKEKFTIPQSSIIEPHSYLVFTSSKFNLNSQSRDTVRLLKENSVIDSYSYQKGPGEGYSYGRIKDGDDTWVVFTTPTQDKTNNNASVLPTPTPTPTPIPTPLPTQVTTKPTLTPTMIPSRASARQASPSKTKPFATKSLEPFSENTFAISSVEEKASNLSSNEAVLAETTKSAQLTGGITPSVKPSKTQAMTKAAFAIMPFLSAIVGFLLLVTCGILWFFRGKNV